MSTSEIDKLLNPALGVAAFEKVASRLTTQRLSTLGGLIQERITALEAKSEQKRAAEKAERMRKALAPQKGQLEAALSRATQSTITALAGLYDNPLEAARAIVHAAAAYGAEATTRRVFEEPEAFGHAVHKPEAKGWMSWASKPQPHPLHGFPLERTLATLLTAHADLATLSNMLKEAE